MSGKSSDITQRVKQAYEAHRTRIPCWGIATKRWDILAVRRQDNMTNEVFLLGVDKSRDPDRPTVMRSCKVDVTDRPETDIRTIVSNVFISDNKDALKIESLSCREATRQFGLDGSLPLLARDSANLFLKLLGDERVSEGTRELVERKEADRFSEAGLKAFRDRMNPDALHVLRGLEDFGWADYAFYAEAGKTGEIRRQAGEIYPLMAATISRRSSVRDAVHDGAPLNEALQKVFGKDAEGRDILSRGMLKRLQGAAPRSDIALPRDRVISDLSQLPADWIPKSEKDWDAFMILGSSVGTTLKEATGSPLSTLYDSCGGRWEEFLHRCALGYRDTRPPQGTTEESMAYFKEAIPWKELGKASREDLPDLVAGAVAGVTVPEGLTRDDIGEWLGRMYMPDMSPGAITNASRDIHDMIAFFANQIVMPLAARAARQSDVYLTSELVRDSASVASRILMDRKSAPHIFELGRKWHNRIADLMARIDEVDGGKARRALMEELGPDGWPRITEPVVAPNGVHIVPLTTPEQLREEGRRLNHCVGGYSGACRDRGHHIVSMRSAREDGEMVSLSTAEIKPVSRSSLHLDVAQHRGLRNGTPPDEAAEAFRWYRKAIREGTIEINHDMISDYLGQRHANADRVQLMCGYDWQKPRTIDMVYDIWKDFLPKRYRKMAAQDVVREPDMQDLVTRLSPGWGAVLGPRP